MTCIVGLVSGAQVFIGGDSAGVSGYDLRQRADRKVFRNGEFLFGCTSSFRMIQLLRYALQPPKRFPDRDVEAFLATDFVNAVRQCLKDGGFASKNSDVESGGCFLLGYAGRLFTVHNDYQVAESIADYAACGCGEAYACGAMFASGLTDMAPRDRVQQALAAAEAHSAGVRAPFHIESL